MIAKNFKFLYRHFQDKQEVLAQMFRVPQSNISGYVNGTKPIPVDILQKIAMNVPIYKMECTPTLNAAKTAVEVMTKGE